MLNGIIMDHLEIIIIIIIIILRDKQFNSQYKINIQTSIRVVFDVQLRQILTKKKSLY